MLISKEKQKLNLNRKQINKIKSSFKSFPETKALFLYGSQLSGNISKNSDIDLLLVVTKLNDKLIKNLKENIQELERTLDTKVSLNVHTIDELNPLHKRKNIFIHKNRSELVIYKYKYIYLTLTGKNIFKKFKDPSPKEIRQESIKILSSFSYFLKKFIFNSELAPHKEKEFIRTPLISLEYIAAFYGYISLDKMDAFNYLKEKKLINTKQQKFFQELIDIYRKGGDIKDKKIKELEVIELIDILRNKLIYDYLKYGLSDLRVKNNKIQEDWALSLPQAVVMAIVNYKDKILLLKRTSDDYLYPNKWTLPGGYVKKSETPEEAIRRELFEETGLKHFYLEALFSKMIISDRVAISCYKVNIREKKINLSEHNSYKFVRLKNVMSRDLTSETRLILNTYFNQ